MPACLSWLFSRWLLHQLGITQIIPLRPQQWLLPVIQAPAAYARAAIIPAAFATLASNPATASLSRRRTHRVIAALQIKSRLPILIWLLARWYLRLLFCSGLGCGKTARILGTQYLDPDLLDRFGNWRHRTFLATGRPHSTTNLNKCIRKFLLDCWEAGKGLTDVSPARRA